MKARDKIDPIPTPPERLGSEDDNGLISRAKLIIEGDGILHTSRASV